MSDLTPHIDPATGRPFDNTEMALSTDILRIAKVGSGIASNGEQFFLFDLVDGDRLMFSVKNEKMLNGIIKSLELIRKRMYCVDQNPSPPT